MNYNNGRINIISEKKISRSNHDEYLSFRKNANKIAFGSSSRCFEQISEANNRRGYPRRGGHVSLRGPRYDHGGAVDDLNNAGDASERSSELTR